ncbi:MAG: hypothetical protein AB2693_12730, partial [Candidatus Thiodiazotropha sp.]
TTKVFPRNSNYIIGAYFLGVRICHWPLCYVLFKQIKYNHVNEKLNMNKGSLSLFVISLFSYLNDVKQSVYVL